RGRLPRRRVQARRHARVEPAAGGREQRPRHAQPRRGGDRRRRRPVRPRLDRQGREPHERHGPVEGRVRVDHRVVRPARGRGDPLRRRPLRQRARLVRLRDPDLPAADRARRPRHGPSSRDDALLHDDPGGGVARRPGGRDGRQGPGLRAGHGRAGPHPRPREADDPAVRSRRGRGADRLHGRPRRREDPRGALERGREGGPDLAPEDHACRPRRDRPRLARGVARGARAPRGGRRHGRRRRETRRDGQGAAPDRHRGGSGRHVALTSQAPAGAAGTVARVDPLDGLNPEQRRAAEAVRGPVCILAGAGSGKTTTITRRIAQQVASSAFAPQQLMAVTFTDKAAGELKARLAALGVSGVRASTFHAAALRQLRHFEPDAVGRILPSKALALRQIANGLPAPFKFRPAGDLATEIEWAKNRRLDPQAYAEVDRDPPIPPDLMVRVYREYERRKAAEGLVDFEDLLELAVRLFAGRADVRETFRAQYLAFTADEVQDVNLLQQTLLDLWLGERDDLCVVGDDYQSIYGFTGASPDYLLGVPDRFPHALVVRLEENY